MKTSKEIAEVLNDLVEIHNDRIAGYERAINELKDEDAELKSLFSGFIAQSGEAKRQLAQEVRSVGEEVEKGTTSSGKIYRAWMDIKAVFTGKSTHTVLENCEFGEDAALKAYDTALEEDDIPAYIRELLLQQQNTLLTAHDEVKALRDQYVS